MNPRNRKIVLCLFVGLLIVVAGCSAVQDTDDSTTPLLLANQDNADHAVVVEIVNGGAETYSAGTTIAAESDVELAAVTQTGEYDVRVSVDGDSTTLTHTFTEDDSQSATTIGIDNDGNVTIGT